MSTAERRPRMNDVLPCGTPSARKRHIAQGRDCDVCGTDDVRLPDRQRRTPPRMTTAADHPDDLAHRRAIASTLCAKRIWADMKQSDLAKILGVSKASVSSAERAVKPDRNISSIQRHARAVGHVAHLVLHDIPEPPTTAYGRLLEELADSSKPEVADPARRSLVLHALVAARHTLGIDPRDVAAGMGVGRMALYSIELEDHDPRLGTYQRYARAIGGRLTVELRPLERAEAAA